MSKDKFPVVVAGIVTNQGDVLIGKKEEEEDHPISGQWHIPGGHLDDGEEIREAARREIEEETGLKVEVYQIVEIYKGEAGIVRVLLHCESDSREAEAKDDLDDIKWVSPEDLSDELGEYDSEIVENKRNVSKFLDKLEKMPVF